MVLLRPYTPTSGISALLLLVAFSANATSIEISSLGNSKVPSRLEVTLINESGGVSLNPKPGAPLVFDLPPPAEGAWEEMLSVTADGDTASFLLRITRFHRQQNRLRVPLYLDPNPPGEINNPQAREIEPSQQGPETSDENVIKYFKAAYAVSRIKLGDGPFPARVELAYFDRALSVTENLGFIPVAEKAATAVESFVQNSDRIRARMKRVLESNTADTVPKLDHAKFEAWTDILLLKSNKLHSAADACLLALYYSSKLETLEPKDKATINKILGYDEGKWQEVRKLADTCARPKPP